MRADIRYNNIIDSDQARLAQAAFAPPQLRLQGREGQQQQGEHPPAAQGRGLSA